MITIIDNLCYFDTLGILELNGLIMNISLTTELETYVRQQVQSGYYKSASEVMREALRHFIQGDTETRLEKRLQDSRQQYADGNFKVADKDFFDGKIQKLKAQIDNA